MAAVCPVAWVGASPIDHLERLVTLEQDESHTPNSLPQLEAFIQLSRDAVPKQAPDHLDPWGVFSPACPGARLLRARFPDFPLFRLLPGGPVWAVRRLLDYTNGGSHVGKNTLVLEVAITEVAGGAAPPPVAVLKLTGYPARPAEAEMAEGSAVWVHSDAVYSHWESRKRGDAGGPGAELRAELDASLQRSLGDSGLGAVARVIAADPSLRVLLEHRIEPTYQDVGFDLSGGAVFAPVLGRLRGVTGGESWSVTSRPAAHVSSAARLTCDAGWARTQGAHVAGDHRKSRRGRRQGRAVRRPASV